jgi:hypothetical protein
MTSSAPALTVCAIIAAGRASDPRGVSGRFAPGESRNLAFCTDVSVFIFVIGDVAGAPHLSEPNKLAQNFRLVDQPRRDSAGTGPIGAPNV